MPVLEPTSPAGFRPYRWRAAGDAQACDGQRGGERHAVTLPALLTWKDYTGAIRVVNAVTCNVSQHGVYVECASDVSIPLYRLVLFECHVRRSGGWAASPRGSRMLSAVYRVTRPTSSGEPSGLALRILSE
jgi:hypothetical protein